MTFVYPQNRELQSIGPIKVARLAAARLGFEIMPMRSVNAGMVEWTQKDNYFGLQQLRGLDGRPNMVKQIGNKRFSYEPGIYGEFSTITETELTKRAGTMTPDQPIPIGDLVLDRQDQLIIRELDRMEQIIWTLLTTGTFSISAPGSGVVFTDTFSVQTASRAVAWATSATATPLVDFRALGLLGAGFGVNFGASAKAYMNRVTANRLLNNSNSADLGGKRKNVGSTINSLADVNTILADNDVPQVAIYDEGYYDDSNTFQRFIPTGTAVVVGSRTSGERVGEYVLTRNANNPGMAPGSYDYVIDRTGNGPDGQKQTPPNMEVHRGHNGGPVIYFPSAVVVLTTG